MPRGTGSTAFLPSISATEKLKQSPAFSHSDTPNTPLPSPGTTNPGNIASTESNASQSRTNSLNSALQIGNLPHLTRRECMHYRALALSPRSVPPYPPVASTMAQIADHLRTASVQSVQDHGEGGQQLLSLSSDLNVEAARQIQHACGQPTASLCDALRWL